MPPPQNTSPILNGEQMPVSPMSSRGGLPPAPPKHSIGPVAGAIIVILLLIAGGLYFWGAQLNQQQDMPPYIPSDDMSTNDSANITADTGAGLPPQSSSDDVSSIEADAHAMNMEQLDASNSAEMNGIF